MLCIVLWSTTLHQGQFHRFLFFCYVLLCYVLFCDLPPFIKVNSTASYSFVMYCYAMYCSVIYHPSSKSIPPLLILLLCIVMLCIVRSRTTLHHSQFHQVKVIRNSEVLLPNFLWSSISHLAEQFFPFGIPFIFPIPVVPGTGRGGSLKRNNYRKKI